MKSTAQEDFINSPELKAFRNAWKAEQEREEAEDQAWWDSLQGAEKAQAFRQIIKLMYKAEVSDRGSYRHALYEVFGLDYGEGFAYYMQLHNLICQGFERQREAFGEYDKQHCDETSA